MNLTNLPPTVAATDPHKAIVEAYSFDCIDRGVGADETPLFTRSLDGTSLYVVPNANSD